MTYKKIAKSKFLESKKGLDYYTLIISIVGILILSFVLINLFTKQLNLTQGFVIGTEQFKLLKAYSTGEELLSVVDNSARLALEQAAYDTGKNGLLEAPNPGCGNIGKINYWTKDSISPGNECNVETSECYPDADTPKNTVDTFFSAKLENFIDTLNSKNNIQVPFDYKPFTYSQISGGTEVVGESNQPIKIEIPNIKYEVKSSFRESIPIDVIAESQEVVGAGHQINKRSRSVIDSKISQLNSAGKLKWTLDYSSVGSSCSYDVGPCTYPCNPHDEDEPPDCNEKGEDCTGGGTITVWDTCDGTITHTVTYNEVNSKLSAAEAAKGSELLVYNSAKSKPEFGSLVYDFGLSWIETTGSSEVCG